LGQNLPIIIKAQAFFQVYISAYVTSFFSILLIIIIYLTIKYRKKFVVRLVIAFAAILIVQIINFMVFFTDKLPGMLVLIKAVAPMLVPLMSPALCLRN